MFFIKKLFDTLKIFFHIFEGVIAEIYFGFPSRKIKIIGITGTDGKTTTAHLIYHILRCSGYHPALISSIYADTGDKKQDTGVHTTTPRPFMVRRLLHQAVKAKCDYFVLETTSHAMSQERVWGIFYTSSAITNVTHEHQLHHNSFDDYLRSKVKLLLRSKYVYVNKDMKAYKQVRNELRKHRKEFGTYSTKSSGADFVWPKNLRTNLKGEFNRQNIMAAYSVVLDLGVSSKQIEMAIKTFKLPKGRFDVVYNAQFTVIIDFAHTPNSIAQILSVIRQNYLKSGRSLIHVFGAASERDDFKRPMMGTESAKYADKIIITEEDYRREDINKIFNEIEKGIITQKFICLNESEFKMRNIKRTYTKIANRFEAISLGISMLNKGDVFVITGKSHEKSLNRGGVEETWDEYKAVSNALKKYHSIQI